MSAAPRDVLLAGAGLACAAGVGLGPVWQALLEGRRFETDIARRCASPFGDYQRAMLAPGLDDQAPHPGENRAQTLTRRALEGLPPLPPDTGLIWCGAKGEAESIEARAENQPLAQPWAARHYRRWLADLLKLHGSGPALEANAACASSTLGLALGAEWIATGRADTVLVAAADVVTGFVFKGFAALKALTPGRCRPFDARRDGLMLGDGAAALLLTAPEAAERLGLAPRARLSGWGASNDANHITGPARDGAGLAAACRAALDRAGIEPDALAAVCAHGTGTVYNDAMELRAMESCCGPRPLPMFSVKGAIGHTLGAAGAIEAALCVEALQAGRIPPTAGFAEAEPGAEGRVAATPQPISPGPLLSANAGFGGVNAALVLERGTR